MNSSLGFASYETLRRFSKVFRYDSSEFLSVFDCSLRPRFEVCIEDVVADVFSLMRALKMVVVNPRFVDVVELAETEADEVIQAGFLDCADEAFAKSICAGSTRWNSYCPNACVLPECIEAIRVLPISVTNQIAGFDTDFFKPHGRVPRLLHYPVSIWMIGRGTTVDLTSTQMNENEYIGCEHATHRVNRFRKEIASNQDIHMGMDKCCPRHGRFDFRLVGRGMQPRFLEDFTRRRNRGGPHGLDTKSGFLSGSSLGYAEALASAFKLS